METFAEDQAYYIVTELMPMGDLVDYLSRQQFLPLDEENVKHIIWQVCQALRTLHSNHIIHRDVKLDNIFVGGSDDQPCFKLSDLGTATKLASATETR